jgi:hypothetical protein
MMPANLFSTELKIFEQHREEWFRSHPGEYIVIQDNVVSEKFCSTYAEAFNHGLQKFGVSRAFLIKQSWITEPVYSVS